MSITSFISYALRLATTAGVSLLLPACTVGPDYRKPDTSLPKEWTSSHAKQNGKDEVAIELAWWRNFHDPILNQLIAKAARSNPDVKIAGTRISEARALRASADAALFPMGDVMASANRQRNQIGFPSSAPVAITSAVKNPFNIFKIGFDASWELDLFGGHRRDAEAAEAEFEAAVLTRDDILISILAEVARTYVEIRQFQAQLSVAQDTVASDMKTTAITKQRFDLGETAGIDLSRAEAQQQHDQAQLPYYSNLLAQAEFSLDVLLGEQPGAAHRLVNPVSGIPAGTRKLLLAAPASVIAQRPDIRNAERKLASATAQQGVAVAKFFPDISLAGFIGLFNTNAGNLLRVSSKSWNMGANILWPILSFGSLSANLAAADARQQEALATYQKTIISALSDVERAFTAYTEQEKYTQSLEKATAADLNIYEIVLKRYEEGLASFLEVLDAQRRLYDYQNQLTLAKAQTSQNLIAVYKSLGGGWKPGAVSGIPVQ
ncbi:MAG: efflux transporter outer membrane subunit [Methylobacter sp.]|nr:efflux transporter outer membrane subunit [Methylobacter sp.]